MKNLIIYYSVSGNTRSIAEMIANEIGADTFEIKTVVDYPENYDDLVEQGEDEVTKGYETELQPIDIDFSQYENIIIGTPVWWYTFAPAIKSFLNEKDFAGQNVYAYATNGGWVGHTFEDIKKVVPALRDTLNIHFAGHDLVTPQDEIIKWADKIK